MVSVQRMEVVVGEGEKGYTAITQVFGNNKVATMARVVTVNPLHPCLPKLPLLIMPTCNKFKRDFVHSQWEEWETLVKELEPVIGPVIGHASDMAMLEGGKEDTGSV